MLVDTDVMIWFLRGNPHAKRVLGKHKPYSLSAVTVMEILQGMRNRQELHLWKSFLKQEAIRVFPLDEQISSKAVFWMEEYTLSHKLRMADALIGATAHTYDLSLLTANRADYKFISGIKVIPFEP